MYCNNSCLICGKRIKLHDAYKCIKCNRYYHDYCLSDTYFTNSKRCIMCENHLKYDILKCLVTELLPGTLCLGSVVGVVIFFCVK